MKIKISKKITVLLVFCIIAALFAGCLKKEQSQQNNTNTKKVELVYYKLFDDEDVMRPLIQEYQAKNPNVIITYRKFTNPDEYYNLILNELAEGEGPDIFSMPNYWFLRNSKKITPLPAQILSPEDFEKTFVSVASKDLVLTDSNDGEKKVFGVPLTVDTLAMYYNKAVYEDKIASRGRPPETWEEFKDDVFRLSKKDNSFEKFEVAGTAMGRSDNIARSLDIFYTLMLQYKANFYNEGLSEAQFSKQQSVSATGVALNPAAEALKLYTSFALPSQKNYSWNTYLADANSPVKEMETFARGKVATIFGYSYLYEQIKAEIQDLKEKGATTIDPRNIRIAPIPQVINPKTSTEKRDAFANYFAETVSRTTAHPEEAWDFLLFLSSKENISYYSQKTFRPTSRRDMIEDQKKDPIYGVFAEQIGYAESFPIYDWNAYKLAFDQAINSVLATNPPADAIRTAESTINAILPPEGIAPKAVKTSNTSNQSSSNQKTQSNK